MVGDLVTMMMVDTHQDSSVSIVDRDTSLLLCVCMCVCHRGKIHLGTISQRQNWGCWGALPCYEAHGRARSEIHQRHCDCHVHCRPVQVLEWKWIFLEWRWLQGERKITGPHWLHHCIPERWTLNCNQLLLCFSYRSVHWPHRWSLSASVTT